MPKIRLGDLSAYLTGGVDGRGGGDGPLFVLMHGFGAAGDDLLPLARFLPSPNGLRWLFPEAPLLLDGGPGRAWWMIDQSLFERRMRGEIVDRSDERPPRLQTARAELEGLLDAAARELAAPRDKQILGGFSQGSMLACDLALHADVRPRGLVLLSSTLIARSEWEPRAARLAGLPILQTHGTRDPILPFADAARRWGRAGVRALRWRSRAPSRGTARAGELPADDHSVS
jgi:phospholipase/carboxylesterase